MESRAVTFVICSVPSPLHTYTSLPYLSVLEPLEVVRVLLQRFRYPPVMFIVACTCTRQGFSGSRQACMSSKQPARSTNLPSPPPSHTHTTKMRTSGCSQRCATIPHPPKSDDASHSEPAASRGTAAIPSGSACRPRAAWTTTTTAHQRSWRPGARSRGRRTGVEV